MALFNTHIYAGMIKGTMNTTTNLFALLIVISFIFPATAIRYAQAQPLEPATPPEETPRVGGPVAQSMENNTTSPSESTASNNTGNATR
jgi:hypothetical protein